MRTQVILNPNGSGGDVFPFLVVGQHLQRLGHHVALMTNPLFQEYAGQAGLEFIGLGSESGLRTVGQDPKLQRNSGAWKLALSWMASTVDESVNYLKHRRTSCPTMFVGSPLSLGMRLAAEKWSIPMATITLSPYLLRSCDDSPQVPPLLLNRWVPRCLKQLQFWLADYLAIDPLLSGKLNPIRQELELPPVRRYLHQWIFSPDLNLGFFPDWFAERQNDWPPNFVHVGSVHWDPVVSKPNETDSVIQWCSQQTRPPFVLLAGSAGPPSSDFYPQWIDIASELDRGLVILEPDRARLPSSLPDHIRHCEYISLDSLLPYAAAVLHSGSIGATLRCASAGVPQVIFPRVNDQFDNANRALRLGIGYRLPPRQVRSISKSTGRRLLERILSDSQLQAACQRVSAWNQSENSAARAAELIHSTFRRSIGQN